MLATRGRRLLRRQLLGLPIGMYLFVVLDGSWTRTALFWWPASGWSFPDERSLIVARGLWSVVLELDRASRLAVFLWSRFGLSDPARRHRFLTTGQLDRAYMKGTTEVDDPAGSARAHGHQRGRAGSSATPIPSSTTWGGPRRRPSARHSAPSTG